MRPIFFITTHSHLVDSNQSGYELHHHDLHLEALFRVFQLLQEFLWKIWKQKNLTVRSPMDHKLIETYFFLCTAAVAVRWGGCCKRWGYLGDRELGEWRRSWTPLLFFSSCVSVKTVGTLKGNIWIQMKKCESSVCGGCDCDTLRTFIALSSFFLFLDVFLPVEYLTFRSRTVGPSPWNRRPMINRNINGSKRLLRNRADASCTDSDRTVLIQCCVFGTCLWVRVTVIFLIFIFTQKKF